MSERLTLSDNFNSFKSEVEEILGGIVNSSRRSALGLVQKMADLLEDLPINEMTEFRSIMHDLEQSFGNRLDDLDSRVTSLERRVELIDRQEPVDQGNDAEVVQEPVPDTPDPLLPAEMQAGKLEAQLNSLSEKLDRLRGQSSNSAENTTEQQSSRSNS